MPTLFVHWKAPSKNEKPNVSEIEVQQERLYVIKVDGVPIRLTLFAGSQKLRAWKHGSVVQMGNDERVVVLADITYPGDNRVTYTPVKPSGRLPAVVHAVVHLSKQPATRARRRI